MLKQANDFLAVFDQHSTLIPCSTMLLHKMLMKGLLVVGAEVAQAANIPIQGFFNIHHCYDRGDGEPKLPQCR